MNERQDSTPLVDVENTSQSIGQDTYIAASVIFGVTTVMIVVWLACIWLG